MTCYNEYGRPLSFVQKAESCSENHTKINSSAWKTLLTPIGVKQSTQINNALTEQSPVPSSVHGTAVTTPFKMKEKRTLVSIWLLSGRIELASTPTTLRSNL